MDSTWSRIEIGGLDLVEDRDWWTRPGRGSRLVDSTWSRIEIGGLDRRSVEFKSCRVRCDSFVDPCYYINTCVYIFIPFTTYTYLYIQSTNGKK